MFIIDTNITDLKTKERTLYKAFFSVNIHQVATPELSAEDAKSYVFFFGEDGKYLSYIGLHFLHTDRKMYYRHSANPFSERELPAVEEEARNFVEDMGAMMDELALAKMSDMEKDRWIDEQDIFFSKKKTEEQSAADGVAQLREEQSAPVAPPAPPPASEVAPAVPSAPPEKSAPVEQTPVPIPGPIVQAMTEPGPALAEQSQIQSPVQSPGQTPPQRKQAATPRQSAHRPKTTAPVSDPQPPVNNIMEQAVKAGIIKAPKQPLKKDIRSSSGAMSRDKEALARLLASF